MDPIYELQVFGVFWNLSTPLILLSFWSAFFCCFFLFPSLFPYFYNFFISSPPFPSLQNFNFSFHPPHYATIPPPLKPHGRRGPRAAPRAGTPAPSRGAPWRAAARPRRPRRRSTPWLLQKLRSERTSFMFFFGFFHNFRKPLFFRALRPASDTRPREPTRSAFHRRRSIGSGGSGVRTSRWNAFETSFNDLNGSQWFQWFQWSQWFLDSWILAAGVFLEISFFRSLSLSLAFSLFLHCTSYEFFCWTSLFDLS